MSILQIARRAGVSTATVSRVLNDLPGVRNDTKQQVRLAVEELKYVVPLVKRGPKPGSIRRSRIISRQSVGTIVVLAIGSGLEWLKLPVMASVVSGIAREANKGGTKVLVEEMIDPSKPSPSLLSGEVDGAIVFLSSELPASGFREALMKVQQYVPAVWAMGGDAGMAPVDHVIPDDRAIARLAFEHLAEKSCDELAFLTVRPKWAMMRNRGQYFAGLAHDAGKPWSAYIVSEDPRDGDLFGPRTVVERDLGALLDRLAIASPRPTGLFIGNDADTSWVHPMLLNRGVVPGKDILLVSCDNEEVRLAGLIPRPLSIDIGSVEVGAAAVRRLAFRINHRNDPPMMMKVAPFLPGA
jgi:DNA-binding LacI/PurR family transcriptional regulator